MDGLNFPNGLTLSPKEDFLLLLESGKEQILKYNLVGEKKGQSELFSVMPGTPDNITPNGDDGYFVGIIFPMTSGVLDRVLRHLRSCSPSIKAIARLARIIQLGFKFTNDYIIESDLIQTLGTTINLPFNCSYLLNILYNFDIHY
jgi:hypothetical protein